MSKENKQNEHVAVGAEWVEKNHNGFGPVHRIEKVYKSGNFITDKSDRQQYRVFSNEAFATGDHFRYDGPRRLVPLTDDIRPAYDLSIRGQKSRRSLLAEIDRVRGIVRGASDQEVIDVFDTLFEALKGVQS